MFAKYTSGACLVLVAGCGPCPFCNNPPAENKARVVLQITETENAAALDRMVTELRVRNLTAAILVNGPFASQNCDQLQALRDDGHEILAFVRPDTGTLSELTRAQQEQLIGDTKTALENCLGAPVKGFRATRFDQNQDTWEIVNALGFEYNLAFVAGESFLPGHETDVLPYQSSAYGFWAIPMHAADNQGRRSAFCDNPFSDLSAEEWEALLKSEFDKLRARGEPLLVEFHPALSGVDEGRFQAFVRFLDYAVAQDAEFLSVAEYVAWAQSVCDVCNE
jgi:peptidoglycan/xylan/chitin deacetylase (PgdA/CDA1 family)